MPPFYSEKSKDGVVYRYSAMHKCSYRRRSMWIWIHVLPIINWFYAESSVLVLPHEQLLPNWIYFFVQLFFASIVKSLNSSYFLILSCRVGGWSVCHLWCLFLRRLQSGKCLNPLLYFKPQGDIPAKTVKLHHFRFFSNSEIRSEVLSQSILIFWKNSLWVWPAQQLQAQGGTGQARPAAILSPSARGPLRTAPGPALPNTPKPYRNIKLEGEK